MFRILQTPGVIKIKMKITSIIVTYNLNFSKLKKCVSSLLQQVEKIIIVKNSPEKLDFAGLPQEKIIQIQLDKNYGIAYAQNRGIEKSISLGAEWILLSDQDTEFPDNYVENFTLKIKKYGIEKIYAPAFYNEIKNQKDSVSVSFCESTLPVGDEPLTVRHAIASGMIFHKNVFEKTGGMSEKLFIDYVDFEFCWHAENLGIKTFVFPDIVIQHNLGDSFRKIFGKKITLRSDFRYFYMLRNGFYLSKNCGYLSEKEKKSLRKRTRIFAAGIVIISKSKISAFKLVRKAFFESKKMESEK